jgi:pimeloyl-ACP methyl ester carboxylesterase
MPLHHRQSSFPFSFLLIGVTMSLLIKGGSSLTVVSLVVSKRTPVARICKPSIWDSRVGFCRRTNKNRLYTTSNIASQEATPSSTSVSDRKLLPFETTPLGRNGAAQMDGLDLYQVPADDDHPLSVYGIQSTTPVMFDKGSSLRPVLLLHGRTWSAVPVYHLLGGTQYEKNGQQSRSLMEALLAKGLQPYTMDFRGFGGTHADETGYVEPSRCVQDTEVVLEWIARRHGMVGKEFPALFGWSQGALVAQLVAQKTRPLMSKLILYGSIYDPMVRYPREPLYSTSKPNRTVIENTFDNAIEDFTIEGSIAPEPARLFAEAALQSDPVKAVWRHLYQFNNCDPGRVHVPTLVVAGDQDPYAPLHVQQELFCNLGRASDRTWSILADSDHAVHLLEGRERFISTVVSFVKNGKRSENDGGQDYTF